MTRRPLSSMRGLIGRLRSIVLAQRRVPNDRHGAGGVRSTSAYEINCDASRLDVAAIHRFLSQSSYWCPGIPRAIVERAVANSLCFGVYCQQQQVGFARVITDKATFAYLADVYVLPEHRGNGIAQRLLEQIMGHPELQGLRRMLLFTRDAHSLYAKFGFKPLAVPKRVMEIHHPGLYARARSRSNT